jgi:formylglycine-generating enzyme required for sulfatase activity
MQCISILGLAHTCRAAASLLALLAAAGACTNDDDTTDARRDAPADAIPEQLTVPSKEATLGHQTGTFRVKVTLPEYRITRFPVTVGDYRRCVDAKRCASPPPTAEPDITSGTFSTNAEHDRLPIVGVTREQAATYCGWVGGKLPTYAQWQIAARGSEVRRFSWGDAETACDRFMYGVTDGTLGCCGASCSRVDVGSYPGGASPTGVEDVLLTQRGELIRADSAHAAMSCGGPACVVRSLDGVTPSIDGFAPARTNDFGFRCVWEGTGK